MISGLADLNAKGAATAEERHKKQELLDDPAPQASLGDFLFDLALQGPYLVAEIVNKASGRTVLDAISPKAQQEARALVDNVARERVPDADRGYDQRA